MMGPTPLALRKIWSFSLNKGVACRDCWICSVSVSTSCSSQAICGCTCGRRLKRVLSRWFFSMVSIWINCRRRAMSADRCWTASSGRTVGCNLAASPKRASKWASSLSVLASRPSDLANSRTRPGLIKATGIWRAHSSLTRGHSKPPVDSTTTRAGCSCARRRTVASIPVSSLRACQNAPAWPTPISRRSLEISMPTKGANSLFILPPLFDTMKMPVLAEFGLTDHTTVRALFTTDTATLLRDGLLDLYTIGLPCPF